MAEPRQLYLWRPNQDFLANLTASRAVFLIVGGQAIRFYVPGRETSDLDILIEPTEENATRIINALARSQVSFDTPLTPSMLTRPKVEFPIRRNLNVDILTPSEQFDFAEALKISAETKVTGTLVRVAAISALLDLLSNSKLQKHKNDIRSLKVVRGDHP